MMMWIELIGATVVATALAIGAVRIIRYLVRRERGRESFPADDLRRYLADMEQQYAPNHEAARKRFEQTQKEKGVNDHE